MTTGSNRKPLVWVTHLRICWNDLSLYDLVINVDKLGLDAAAEMIVNLAKTEYIQECSLSALNSILFNFTPVQKIVPFFENIVFAT
jgi:hypothetical protein